jgi:hypothetical protein
LWSRRERLSRYGVNSLSAQKIEYLYYPDCPSHPEALDLLRGVLAERGIESLIEVHEVTTDDEAQRLAFPGSPTIRIDGRDVDPAAASMPAALSCRVYRLPDGRVSPVPSRALIEAALR